MKKICTLILVLVSVFLSACSCQSERKPGTNDLVSNVALSATMEVQIGQSVQIGGEGFMMGDVIVFKAHKTFECPVTDVRADHATIVIAKGFLSGKYEVSLQRDSEFQILGSTTVSLVTTGEPNVSGKVLCDGKPMSGVRVSDGLVWATTDSNGEYILSSDKSRGHVFVVIPSGTFPEVDRGFPQFWKPFSSANIGSSETLDFHLFSQKNDSHKMIFSADWHIAGRLNDVQAWTSGYKAEMAALGSGGTTPIYEIALGDITWDSFWDSGKYTPAAWKTLNSGSAHPIFTVMGNHDYNLKSYGSKDNDLAASAEYRKALGPAYYSMNIGKVHYIILDNIIYDNSNGTAAGRSATEQVSEEQIAWIKEDLKSVGTETPIVVAAHAPFYRINPGNGVWKQAAVTKNASAVLKLFSDYQDVRVFVGHQHVHQFKDYKAAGQGFAKNKMIEYTVPPIGGTLWTTQYYVSYDLGTDGCPPGYDCLSVKGTQLDVKFKAIGESEDYQMRVYDMNKVKAFWDDKSNSSFQAFLSSNPSYSFSKCFGEHVANSVLINVFFGDPDCRNMKLEVSEDGKSLRAENVAIYDPQHVVAYEYPYYTKEKSINSSYKSVVSSHLFMVKASSATSTITVKLTDASGKVYTQSFSRPKAFDTTTNH